MSKKRKQISNSLKAKIAVEAIKENITLAELSQKFGIHSTQILRYKKQAIEYLPEIFSKSADRVAKDIDKEKDELYKHIGQLKVELDWLKKNQDLSIEQMKGKIEFTNKDISVSRQCELLGLARSTLYYEATGVSDYNLEIMKVIDEQYLLTPFYGSRRMLVILQKKGYNINRKRVKRLMRLMGIHAIYPKRNLSIPCKEHEIYPYLLRGLVITRANQVWSSDITYIRLKNGFVYLVAIMDWFSRKVLAWEISITLESDFCITALEKAISKFGKPEIFNTDQGVQFTSNRFIKILKAHEIKISMDGKGRALDNIFIERLWRSVKHEEVYIKDYEGVKDAAANLNRYFYFYNHERPHQSLDYRTPDEEYNSSIAKQVEERKGA